MQRFDEFVESKKLSDVVAQTARMMDRAGVDPVHFISEWINSNPDVEASILEYMNQADKVVMEVNPAASGGMTTGGVHVPPGTNPNMGQQPQQPQMQTGLQSAGQGLKNLATSFFRGQMGFGPAGYYQSSLKALTNLVNVLSKVQGADQIIQQVKDLQQKLGGMKGDIDNAQATMTQFTQSQGQNMSQGQPQVQAQGAPSMVS